MLEDEYHNEDIIRKEISLLEKYRSQPSCSELSLNLNKFNTLKLDDVFIVWRYYPETNTLKKVILNNEFVVVYDNLKVVSINNKCKFTTRK